jgi:membrane protein YdbS with pleckstrin-like domain
MDINHSQTRDRVPINKKKIYKKTLVSSIGLTFLFGVLGLIFIGIAFASENSIGYVLAVINFLVYIACVFLVYMYHTWHFATYYYEALPEYVMIKKGPIIPSEITILYQKIQDVYVDQDLFDRFFGLYDVHVATATFTSGNLAHIDGLLKADSDGLRDELLKLFKSKVVK